MNLCCSHALLVFVSLSVSCLCPTVCCHRSIVRPTHTSCPQTPQTPIYIIDHTPLILAPTPIPALPIGPRSLSQTQSTGEEQHRQPVHRHRNLRPPPTTIIPMPRIRTWSLSRQGTPPRPPDRVSPCLPPIPAALIVRRTYNLHRFRPGGRAARMRLWRPRLQPSVQRLANWNVTAGRTSPEMILYAARMHPRHRRPHPPRAHRL